PARMSRAIRLTSGLGTGEVIKSLRGRCGWRQGSASRITDPDHVESRDWLDVTPAPDLFRKRTPTLRDDSLRSCLRFASSSAELTAILRRMTAMWSNCSRNAAV